jgi:serine/threonine-protein kinase
LKRIGRYEVLEKLGAGGMGVVYRGRDTRLGREVAIKTIQFDRQTSDAEASRIQRFNVEAQVVARLGHPNIVTIHDVAEEDGVTYIVMELVSGADLHRVLERGPLSPDETVRLIFQVASALDHAHDNGVLHRDVKPANLMLRQDGTVKLMDFGIAKVREMTGLTQTGYLMGTMEYIAPEILRLEECRRESDQYSLGVVAFELLAGKRPFHSPTPQAIAAAVLTLPPPSICMARPLLPQTLDPVFARVLAKDPASRYRSCAEFAQALADAVMYGLDTARPIDFAASNPPLAQLQKVPAVEPVFAGNPPYPEPNRGRGGMSWTTAAIVFVLLAEGAWLLHRHFSNEPDAAPPQTTATPAVAEPRRDPQPAEPRSPAPMQPEPARANAPPPPARSSAEPQEPGASPPPKKDEIIAAGRRIVTELLPCFQGKGSADCWPRAKPHVSSLVSALTVSRDSRRFEFEQLAVALNQDPASQSSIVKLIVASRSLLDANGETDLP